MGNLLIALPADLLLIYTYVRDRKSKRIKKGINRMKFEPFIDNPIL